MRNGDNSDSRKGDSEAAATARSDVGGETPPADEMVARLRRLLIRARRCAGEMDGRSEALTILQSALNWLPNLESQLAESSRSLIEAQREREELRAIGDRIIDVATDLAQFDAPIKRPGWRSKLDNALDAWRVAFTKENADG